MSPSKNSAAATGPGCGGTSACIAAKAPAAGQGVVEHRAAEASGDGDDDGQEDDQPGVEEDREAEQQRRHPERERRTLLPEPADQGVRQHLGSPGHLEQPAEHHPEPHQERHRAERAPEPGEQCGRHVGQRDAGSHGGHHADQHQRDEGVQPHADDQEQQQSDGRRRDDQQQGGAVHRGDGVHESSRVPRWRRPWCHQVTGASDAAARVLGAFRSEDPGHASCAGAAQSSAAAAAASSMASVSSSTQSRVLVTAFFQLR